jgi:NADPH:quinone reductase-like Zn-dependent oxidoreductase
MSMQQWAAILATIVLGMVMVLQVLLAAGFPLGQAAWRGQYRVLPHALRWASLATVGVLGLAVWVVLARAGLAAPGAGSGVGQVATWVFAAFFVLNTIGNIASRSTVERYVMTPVTVLLVICFIVVALSRLGT